ncbi:MAG TPA: ankyrin repeat domain-containing protein [Polyangiaceae bacterium]|jgi:hypothetical protein
MSARKWSWGGASEEDRFDEITYDAGRFRFFVHPADPRGYGVVDSEKTMRDDELLADGPPWEIPLAIAREIVADVASVAPRWLLVLELCEAARAGDERGAADLVAGGADPDGRVFQSRTPLASAIGARRWAMVCWLVARGARDGSSLDTTIGLFDDTPEAEGALVALLDAGARWTDAPGRSPLFSVSNARAARVLIARGAPVNVAQLGGSDGSTPLFFAIGRNDVALVDLLIDAGADLTYRDRRGRTAVMQAVLYCHVEALGRLIAAGADVTVADASGKRPLDEARRLAAATGAVGKGPASYATRAATIAEQLVAARSR